MIEVGECFLGGALERRYPSTKLIEVHLEWKELGDRIGCGGNEVLGESAFGLRMIKV